MKKTPFLTLEKAKEIIAEIPTPFHIYDEAGIRANARALKKAFSWNKGYREYFAVKATPNPYILQILKEEGCGCDCASYAELLLAQAVGCTGHDVMFSSNVTPEKDMRKAYEMGVYINLDDATHVDFLARIANGKVPETVCLRYNPGGSFSLGNTIMDMPRDAKYGMTEDQMAGAIRRLMKMGTKHFGIHAFLASNTTQNGYYPELASQLFRLAVRLRNATGCHFSFINLSGGVGVDYRPEQPASDIAFIGEGVRQQYEEILTPQGMDDIAIFTELGRFMLAPYGHLISTVLHQKHIYREYIGLDACAANLMRPAMYGAY
ncbi:MAG: diaminopimelate decarboxylase, partial [Clostridiales bacterium]|nr:diaminopimelate decarboxylase [Clostridiales bacterium]